MKKFKLSKKKFLTAQSYIRRFSKIKDLNDVDMGEFFEEHPSELIKHFNFTGLANEDFIFSDFAYPGISATIINGKEVETKTRGAKWKKGVKKEVIKANQGKYLQ